MTETWVVDLAHLVIIGTALVASGHLAVFFIFGGNTKVLREFAWFFSVMTLIFAIQGVFELSRHIETIPVGWFRVTHLTGRILLTGALVRLSWRLASIRKNGHS